MVVTILALLVTSCLVRDGLFVADGLVVDAQGQPVYRVAVKTGSQTVFSDVRGCFHVEEMTYPDKHRMPFAVEAIGFKSFTGTIDSPGFVRVRVAMVGVVSRDSSFVDPAPVPGALGACEPPTRGSTTE